MEPRRRRPPQETVVELVETTVFEEAGAKAEWRNTRLARRARCAREKKMIIKELDYKKYKGQKYQAEILSDRYLSIDPEGEGFAIKWVMSGEPLRMKLNEDLLRTGLKILLLTVLLKATSLLAWLKDS